MSNTYKDYELEVVYILENATYIQQYLINAFSLNKALSKVQGVAVKEHSKNLSKRNKISYDKAKEYVKDNIEFVSINLYSNNYEDFENEYNPYCYK